MEQNGMGESDSDGACAKPPSKRAKSKSKVWEKVAWFARRSRHRDNSLSVVDDLPDGETAASLAYFEYDMEVDGSPGASSSLDHSALTLRPWGSETSSSSEELSEVTECKPNTRNCCLYPNSEVVEQNCLKPSVARALFHQLELANRNSDSPRNIKTPWQKRKKKTSLSAVEEHRNLNENVFVRSDQSVRLKESPCKILCSPSSLDKQDDLVDITNHCTCCRVNRHVVHVERNLSTKSLDRYHGHRINLQNKLRSSQGRNTALLSKHVNHESLKRAIEHVESDSQISSMNIPYQSSSLPNYFSKSLHERVKCWGIGRSHLPICETLYNREVSSKVIVCRCSEQEESKSPEPAKTHAENEVVKKVSPDDFKTRLCTMKTWFGEFSDEQKNLLLKELLGDCELPQIHLLSLELSPRLHEGCPPNCEDLITWLPKSLALYIMSFLEPVTLCRASQVCRAWYQLANEPCLWRRFSCQPKWRLSCTGEQKQLIQHMMPNETVHWKRVFAERYKLRNNWLKGRCNVRTFEGHTQGISCVQFDDTRIVSGSSDKTIKVWNIRTNTPWSVQTLVGHSGTVRCLHLEGNRLVSGSTDKSIKVWDLSTQQSWSSIACKVTMVGHSDTVRCLQVDDEKVISGSYDKTLKIWDVRTGSARRTLRGHDGAVLCVQFDSKKIISGSSDKTIKVWNFDGECIMTLHGHHDAVTCLQFDQTRIISGSLDSTLKFWDLATGRCINTIDWKASEGHTGVVRCLQADSWRVVSASDDRTLKVWNITTGERLVTLRNHSDGVTCLQFNDNMIVSGSYDKTVKLWDFSCC